MATNIKDTLRATMMGAIPTSVGSSGHLFIYSGSAPSKTASPTGTSAITAGVALGSPMGTVATGTLTLSGAPLTATATASITPGYYRGVDGSTDDGTHTQVQGPCAVITPGSGTANVTNGSTAVTFSTSQSGLTGSYLMFNGDSTSGIYQVASGSGTSWTLASAYGGTTNAAIPWGTATFGAINFWTPIYTGGNVTINALSWTEGNP